MRHSILGCLFCVFILAGCAKAPDGESNAADILVSNAQIYTVDVDQPWAQAMAIRGNEIIYVGELRGAAKYIDGETEQLDLGGSLILPGLVSVHEHPLVKREDVIANLAEIVELYSRYGFTASYNAGNPPGAELVVNSAVAPLDPWQQIEAMMLRNDPEQGLTLEQAIAAYTMGAAGQLGWGSMIGSIEVGKRADLIVLDQNLFQIEPNQIHNTKVRLTMMDGRVVFEDNIQQQ
jgi:predicted amidohydrolase YtcJ